MNQATVSGMAVTSSVLQRKHVPDPRVVGLRHSRRVLRELDEVMDDLRRRRGNEAIVSKLSRVHSMLRSAIVLMSKVKEE